MPTLIKKYPKDLSVVDPTQYEEVATYRYFHKATGYAFELSLCNTVSGYAAGQYSGAVLIWHYDYPQIEEQWIQDYIQELPDTHTPEQIFEAVDAQVVFNDVQKTLVGSICFNSYTGIENVAAVQIRSAYLHIDFQQFKVATQSYTLIARHNNLVVSDNLQTPLAQRLWSNALPRVGEVKVYDQDTAQFVYQITPEDNIEYSIWGIDSATDEFHDIKHEMVQADLQGYKVDLNCYNVLLTFSISDKDDTNI
jgi:hypothetical protein